MVTSTWTGTSTGPDYYSVLRDLGTFLDLETCRILTELGFNNLHWMLDLGLNNLEWIRTGILDLKYWDLGTWTGPGTYILEL